MKRQHLLIALVAVAAVGLGVIAYLFWSGRSQTTVAENSDRGGFTITSQDRTLGSPRAPILMVEYAAPTCPICAAFDTTVFPQIKAKYIDTGKIYYVFRVYPLSSVDVAAEGMARCLPEQNYLPFIDMLYRNQARWDPDGHDIPDVHGALVSMGAMAGMAPSEVDSCMNNPAQQNRTETVGKEAGDKYGVTGTPTFFVNGQKRVGVGEWGDWQSFLNGMLAGK
ncbi:MAG TPA: thioredoxin domain-containing protein [Rhizomicrobium sp.]|nr:thioredoxin domain-containing protein [Rhizomicrobium sp.]